MPTMGLYRPKTRETIVGRDWCCGSTLGISFLGYYVYDKMLSALDYINIEMNILSLKC